MKAVIYYLVRLTHDKEEINRIVDGPFFNYDAALTAKYSRNWMEERCTIMKQEIELMGITS